jgi:hypothetical protein
MRIQQIAERASDPMSIFRELFPNTPEYVIKDFIFKHYQHAPNQIEDEIVDWINSLNWTKQTITVTLDVFDDFTQQRIRQLLKSGNDKRFQYQRDQIASTGKPSNEPIILTFDDGKYELQEGWHRTVESIRTWPDGYKQAAWIGK